MQAREKGATLLLIALMITSLSAIAGLAVDAGYLASVKGQMQTAADAAAVSGAWELANAGQARVITRAARETSRINGFEDGAAATGVTVKVTPDTVETVISRDVPTAFFRLAGQNSVTIRTRAVAKPRPGGAPLLVE
jgi:uncharacterized membrane protein